MANEILLAVVAGAIGLLSGSISFYLTKRAERKDALQKQKREHYLELLYSISDLANDDIELKMARSRFATAVNTVALVAPQYVIDATMAYYRALSERPLNQKRLRNCLKNLVLGLRRSLELPFKDDLDSFEIELVAVMDERRNDSSKK